MNRSNITFIMVMLLYLMFGLATKLGRSEICEEQAREYAKNAIRSEIDRNITYVRTSRCEGLEDLLFITQAKEGEKLSKYAYIYKIYDNGIEIVSSKEFVEHGIIDGESEWHAAVSRQSGKVYVLAWGNSLKKFNELARDANINIKNIYGALYYDRLINKLIPDINYGINVSNIYELKYEIEKQMCKNTESSICDNIFNNWWKPYKTRENEIFNNNELKEKQGRYYVSHIDLVAEKSSGLILKKISYDFSNKGIISPINIKSLR